MSSSHNKSKDQLDPAFDLARGKRLVEKCIATGNQGALDYLIQYGSVDDHGFYFGHAGDGTPKDR